MKPPRLSANQCLTNTFDRFVFATSGTPSSLVMPSSSELRQRKKTIKEEEAFTLYGCIRPVQGSGGLATHCYLKKVDSNNDVETLAFNPNGALGPSMSETLPYDSRTQCEKIGSINSKQWGDLQTAFEKCKKDGYTLYGNNCCTCAAGALEDVSLSVPSLISSANPLWPDSEEKGCVVQ